MKEFITIKTTPEAIKMLRIICANTGEKQYEALIRILSIELSKIETG